MDEEIFTRCYPCNPGKLGYLENLCEKHKSLLHFHDCKQCDNDLIPHFTENCQLGIMIHACGDCIDKGLA